ncbi:class I SAM-dependent methyltransferase [Campylobacter insulaenigrae]|uniref:class I SAM-dependent methyltransferase n=1 Tax=Campylobacter insulaenigrae TaxID=260714 RepID=UPI0021527C84|nr:class I SAM-dependent methyltransferase [Campylobacter insulaenigrae]MCR6570887.1 class I SAM-dependent methyltransferase [Campylobacter insulaenigrae]MCR6577152.1 class I SAM-dependent methyltransferase [Campylobacter insulaenigrae]MCR6581831.1 class I SAM-dependent methyltransferase [Campylobacter insulaenigrae]
MLENSRKLFDLIAIKNPIHSKYLNKIKLDEEDKKEFEKLINFYLQNSITLDELCECYLTILNDTLEETKFFIEHGCYRYNKFDEVKNKVYFNEKYMKKYMVGLALSSYIWIAHIKVRKYFQDYIDSTNLNGNYFEIGPGHGEFFVKALKSLKFKYYLGLDLSPTSCELTKNMVENQVNDLVKKCEFLCKDFFQFDFDKKADLMVVGEVLEHVENPLMFLQRSKELLSDNGEIFATIPINAPAIDHIYLFSHPNEIFDMVKNANLQVKQYECFMANDYSLEKALKFKNAITMAIVLTK